MDLTDQITAFVVTTGEPSTAECYRRIAAQTVRVRVETIANVTPMWRAFQSMLDRCTTPYFVEVDADMLLEPGAIEALYGAIKSPPPGVASVRGWHPGEYPAAADTAVLCGWLWGDAEEQPIVGVKIYDHQIVKAYPFTDALSCEMGQVFALLHDGHDVANLPKPADRAGCLGLHFATQTPAMAFARWQRFAQKHRGCDWMGWLAPHFARIERAWLAEPESAIRKAAYIGFVAGMAGPLPTGEIDATATNQDYRRLAGIVGEHAAGPRELNIYQTDRCNHRCSWCLRQRGERPAVPDVTAYLISTILDTLPTIRSACVAGFGEPLMSPQLPAVLSTLRDRGLVVGLITNGALLLQRATMLDETGLAYVSVSLNAATAAEHAATTGATTWEAVLAGVRRMVAGSTRTGLSSVVTRSNVQRVPAFLALARDLGVAFVHFHNLLPHDGPTPAFLGDVLMVGCPEMAVLDEAREAPGANLVESWPEPIDLAHPPPGRCVSPFVSIGIDGAGGISGCRRVRPPGIGNGWFRDPNVWASAYMSSIRRAATGDREDAFCRHCFGNWRG